MILTDQVQAEISKLLLVVLSIAGAALTTWWQNRGIKKSQNAMHDAKRALEHEIGIQTKWDQKSRRVDVVRIPNGKAPSGHDVQGSGEGKGS